MSLSQQETLAALRLLIGVAKADGILDATERSAMRSALGEAPLPTDQPLDALFAEPVDLRAQYPVFESQEAREQVYEAAYSMTHAERRPSAEERRVLEELREGLHITPAQESLVARLVKEAADTLIPGAIRPIRDERVREIEVDEDIRKYSVITAIMGAIPVPVADIAVNIAVVGVQTKMFHDIGRYYGFTTTKEQVKQLMAAIGAGAGVRVAVVSLAKLVPDWGSLVGAVTNFAATWGLGKVAKRFHESEGRAALAELEELFRSAEEQGRRVYLQEREAIEARVESVRPQLEELARQLKEGRISEEEYQRRVAELA